MKKVAIIMGSDSDFPVVSKAVSKLKEFGVEYEVHVMSAHRTPDAAIKFLMPSVGQKRDWAKGRSLETATTVVLSRDAASSLNLRTEVAQTEVSRLGKMFSTMRRPMRS